MRVGKIISNFQLFRQLYVWLERRGESLRKRLSHICDAKINVFATKLDLGAKKLPYFCNSYP